MRLVCTLRIKNYLQQKSKEKFSYIGFIHPGLGNTVIFLKDVSEFVNKCLICKMWQAKEYNMYTSFHLDKLDLFEMTCIDFLGPRK